MLEKFKNIKYDLDELKIKIIEIQRSSEYYEYNPLFKENVDKFLIQIINATTTINNIIE
jgi:hypothetical protein